MDQLKTWRVSQGITADEAGARVGVGRVQWFRWEKGARKIPAERVLDIERMTGISRHELLPEVFGFEPSEPPPKAPAIPTEAAA